MEEVFKRSVSVSLIVRPDATENLKPAILSLAAEAVELGFLSDRTYPYLAARGAIFLGSSSIDT